MPNHQIKAPEAKMENNMRTNKSAICLSLLYFMAPVSVNAMCRDPLDQKALVQLCHKGQCEAALLESICGNIKLESAYFSNGLEYRIEFKPKKIMAKINKRPTKLSEWKCRPLDKLDGCGMLGRRK